MSNLDATKGWFIFFVAEAQITKGSKIVGFRKEYASQLEDEEYKRYANENHKRFLIQQFVILKD